MWNGAEWFSGGMHEGILAIGQLHNQDCTKQRSQKEDLTSCESQGEAYWRAANRSLWTICTYDLLPLIIAGDL